MHQTLEIVETLDSFLLELFHTLSIQTSKKLEKSHLKIFNRKRIGIGPIYPHLGVSPKSTPFPGFFLGNFFPIGKKTPFWPLGSGPQKGQRALQFGGIFESWELEILNRAKTSLKINPPHFFSTSQKFCPKGSKIGQRMGSSGEHLLRDLPRGKPSLRGPSNWKAPLWGAFPHLFGGLLYEKISSGGKPKFGRPSNRKNFSRGGVFKRPPRERVWRIFLGEEHPSHTLGDTITTVFSQQTLGGFPRRPQHKGCLQISGVNKARDHSPQKGAPRKFLREDHYEALFSPTTRAGVFPPLYPRQLVKPPTRVFLLEREDPLSFYKKKGALLRTSGGPHFTHKKLLRRVSFS